MKKTLFSIIFLISFVNLFSQTEKQTIEFLNQMLAIHLNKPFEDSAKMQLKVVKDTEEGSVFEFETYYNNKLFVTEKFNTKNIDAVITFTPIDKLCLKIISSKSLIQEKYPNKSFSNYNSEMRIVLDTTNEEAMRIKKALEHLLKLNGAKLVDKELFKD